MHSLFYHSLFYHSNFYDLNKNFSDKSPKFLESDAGVTVISVTQWIVLPLGEKHHEYVSYPQYSPTAPQRSYRLPAQILYDGIFPKTTMYFQIFINAVLSYGMQNASEKL